MRIGSEFHLTYCTNIHPGEGWEQVASSLAEYGPRLKQRIAPDTQFGIGLRLSNQASEELLKDSRLQAFREQLVRDGLYVFTINGFPYGSFHRTQVKDLVHAPDWQTLARGDYTIRLARILAALLPDDMFEGSISTSPLSYKPWLWAQDGGDGPRGRGPSREGKQVSVCRACVGQLVRVTQALMEIEQQTGKWIHIDLEPEPDGLLETADEVCAFFRDYLLAHGAEALRVAADISPQDARQALLRHIGVCLDTCHLALEYETPRAFVDKMQHAGIRIGKVQISSALRLSFDKDLPKKDVPHALAPYVESTYLHQVLARNANGTITRYRDLPQALEQLQAPDPAVREWRVHFHVPVFTESCGAFDTTRQTILEIFAVLAEIPFTRHLEIETYTWDVLPAHLKKDLTDSIAREFSWTCSVLPPGLSKGTSS